MPNDDERVARLQRGWKFADAAKKNYYAQTSRGPYDEGNAPGKEIVAPLVSDTADRMRAQGLKGSLRKGGKIHSTGNYRLHKGEQVIPANRVKHLKSAMMKKAK
jgi:hypothetical protein